MDTLILTLQLFTSLPINKRVEVSDERLIRGVALWPAAGIIIGVFDALIFWAAVHILPVSIAAALALPAIRYQMGLSKMKRTREKDMCK